VWVDGQEVSRMRPGEEAEERGLAAARRANEENEIPMVHPESNVLQGEILFPVAEPDVDHLDHGRPARLEW
jgi:hypothetical protein